MNWQPGPLLVSRLRRESQARAQGVLVSSIVRTSLTIFTRDVGDEGVMIRLTPYYRDQMVSVFAKNRAQYWSGSCNLALDGTWVMTDLLR